MYQIFVIDYSHCCFANVYSDAEIEIVYSKTSQVPNKHRKGGQSQMRFQRGRQEAIKQWFKSANEFLKTVDGEIYLGISDFYKNGFMTLLSTYNKQKIKVQYPSEYCNLSGIYQMINRIEKNKTPVV